MQLAWILRNGGKHKLGDLYNDAAMTRGLYMERAVIPSGIRGAYMAQFHEVVARAEGQKFSEALHFILEDKAIEALVNKPSSETGYTPESG